MLKNKHVKGPEATDRLAEAVENLTQRLQVVDDTMTDILHELTWLVRNHVKVRVINRLPADPAGQGWSAKLVRLNPQVGAEIVPESIECSDCDIDSPDSLAAAQQEGWVNLEFHDGESRNYTGLCPSCHEQEVQNRVAPQKPKDGTEREHVKPKRATLW